MRRIWSPLATWRILDGLILLPPQRYPKMSQGTSQDGRDSEEVNNTENDDFTVKVCSPTSSLYVSKHSGLGAWSEHLNKQRRDEECDVVLVTEEGDQQHAHRCILSASSEYFSRMFQKNMFSESEKREIELKGIPGEALSHILDFIYTGVLKLTTENVHAIVAACNYFLLPNAREVCSHFMAEILKSKVAYDEALKIVQTADRFDFDELKHEALVVIYDNLKKIAKSKHFKELSLQEVTSMLKDDRYYTKEENVWLAAITWLEHNLEERKAHLDEVMDCVHFPLISAAVLASSVKQNLLIQASERLKRITDEAIQYQVVPLQRSLIQTPLTKPRGSTCDGVFCMIGTESFFVFMPKYKTWYSLACPLPVQPADINGLKFNLFLVRGQLYSVGVVPFDANRDSTDYLVLSLQIYDEVHNVWEKKALPSKCKNTIFVTCGGHLYACSEEAVEVYHDGSWKVLCELYFSPYEFVCTGAGYLCFYSFSESLRYGRNAEMTTVSAAAGVVRVEQFFKPSWMQEGKIRGVAQIGKYDYLVTWKDKTDKLQYKLVRITRAQIEDLPDTIHWKNLGENCHPHGLNQRHLWHVAASQKGIWVMASHPSIMTRSHNGQELYSRVSDGVIPFFVVKCGTWERLPSIPEQPGKHISLCACYNSESVAACRYR